jgi:Family of unknown function (DUF6494)
MGGDGCRGSSGKFGIVHVRPNPGPGPKETVMNEETLNLSIRKFLKMVGVSSQREIEQAVARAIAAGAIAGKETFPARVTLEIAGLKLAAKFDGDIRLE